MPALAPSEQYATVGQEAATRTFGMWLFLASETLLFAALFALYAAYRAMYGADFVAAIHHNTLGYGTVNMYVLLTSSFTIALAGHALQAARPRRAVALYAVTIALGILFLTLKGLEYVEHVREGALPGAAFHLAALPTFGANRFFSLYWVMTGVHALHVAGGIGVVAWLATRTATGAYTSEHHLGAELGTLYWHLVDVIWIFLWPILYLG